MLDSVVAGFLDGLTAECIRKHYPSLTLEEAYGSIAYYLANRQEVDAYLQKQEKVWDEWRLRVEQQPNPTVERLRALKRSQSAEKS